ncbi:MAG: methyltransferase domain-containing protein [Chloroflexota bacterium]
MQLYIDGLARNITENDLIPLFAHFTSVVSIRVIRNIVSGESRGFALVTVTNDAEGQEAIEKLNGTMLAGRKLVVFKIHGTLPGEMEFREWLRETAREVLNKVRVKDFQTVVDYGCGPGIFSIAAARIVGLQGKVYALDVRPGALEKLREIAVKDGLTNIETMLIDKSTVSLSLDDESANVILLYDVLQEISDKQGLMKELHRVLKTDGVLSVFPMHIGTDKFLDLVNTVGLFLIRDRYGYAGFQSPSEVINLVKQSS